MDVSQEGSEESQNGGKKRVSKRRERKNLEERELELALKLSLESTNHKRKLDSSVSDVSQKAKQKRRVSLHEVTDDDIDLLDKDDKILREKVKNLSDLLKNSEKICVFTGAGISTSAGIPDYRGKNGVWTQYKKRRSSTSSMADNYSWVSNRAGKYAKIWFPTFTHVALSQMMKNGIVDFIISQNCDGLHRKSGIPKEKLIELHGNSFVEICSNCNEEVYRDYIVGQPTLSGHASYFKSKKMSSNSKSNSSENDGIDQKEVESDDHSNSDNENDDTSTQIVSRKCPKCSNGILRHNIVNFGDDIDKSVWEKAKKYAEEADLMLVLGSSLRVKPAMELPTFSKKMVICNLQETPLDDFASLVIRAPCDDVMMLLTDKDYLNLHVTPYCFHICLEIVSNITEAKKGKKKRYLSLQALIPNGTITSFFTSITLSIPSLTEKKISLTKKNNYKSKIPVENSSKFCKNSVIKTKAKANLVKMKSEYQKFQYIEFDLDLSTSSARYQYEFSLTCDQQRASSQHNMPPTVSGESSSSNLSLDQSGWKYKLKTTSHISI